MSQIWRTFERTFNIPGCIYPWRLLTGSKLFVPGLPVRHRLIQGKSSTARALSKVGNGRQTGEAENLITRKCQMATSNHTISTGLAYDQIVSDPDVADSTVDIVQSEDQRGLDTNVFIHRKNGLKILKSVELQNIVEQLENKKLQVIYEKDVSGVRGGERGGEEDFKPDISRKKKKLKIKRFDKAMKEFSGTRKKEKGEKRKWSKKAQLLEKNEKELMEKIEKDLQQEMDDSPRKKVLPDAKRRRNFNFNNDLKSFINVCVFTREWNTAINVLEFYHRKSRIKSQETTLSEYNITDMEIYEALLGALAKEGDWNYVRRVLKTMEDREHRPSIQGYAYILECLGRHNVFHRRIAIETVRQMESEGHDPADIFNETFLKDGEPEFIRKTLKAVIPGFRFNSPRHPNKYHGVLVEQLNKPLPPDQKVETNPYAGIMELETLHEKAEKQKQYEIDKYISVQSIYKSDSPTAEQRRMKNILKRWNKDCRKALKKGFEKIKVMELERSMGSRGMCLYPYFNLFPTEEYVEILMMEIQNLARMSAYHSPTTAFLYTQLGQTIWERYSLKLKIKDGTLDRTMEVYKQYSAKVTDPAKNITSQREVWQNICRELMPDTSLNQPDRRWPRHTMKVLGKILYSIILQDVKIETDALAKEKKKKDLVPKKVQAFFCVYRERSHVTMEEIKPHPVVLQLIENAKELKFLATDMPMIIPPVPWTSPTHGGNMLNNYKILRLPSEATEQVELFKNTKHKEPVLDSLTTLANCAWMINKPMLDLMIEVFNSKGNPDLDIPIAANRLPEPPKLKGSMLKEEKVKVLRERYRMEKEAKEMNSLWYTELYRFSIANKYRNEIFWFPHSMDFRGRTYPIPPHFNHLGGDIARAILKFAKGKPLGEKGLEWLKIHLVNLTGFRKRSSNEDRLAFAEEMMPEIEDSADRPFEGRKWWTTSDEPWQTLAFCKEIMAATRSPDHTKYVCHLPVHQDGSCNGLQHYAALGRDQAGAASVNLMPYHQPQDVYSEVVELVEKERQKDAENGIQIAQMLKGFVVRKVIKQTIMTTVYGVTKYGAKLQILRQLKDIPEFPQNQAWKASIYLTDKTFFCLTQMFTSAKEIQDWFTQSAQLISVVKRSPVEWVTPLNLPIIQPYHKISYQHVLGIYTKIANEFLKPDSVKQKNAFPPNFIHSIDSVHMMLTSLYSHRAGITFVSVHDCFWTHACDVETMNMVTREQFVALHSQPILEDLSQYLINKYCVGKSGEKISPEVIQKLRPVLERIPKRGNFDLQNVLRSTYFFS